MYELRLLSRITHTAVLCMKNKGVPDDDPERLFYLHSVINFFAAHIPHAGRKISSYLIPSLPRRQPHNEEEQTKYTYIHDMSRELVNQKSYKLS